MKNLFALSLFALISSPSFAAQAPVIKTCETVLRFPESIDLPTLIYVLKEGDAYSSQTKQTKNGAVETFTETVEISEHAVREGLSADTDPYTTEFNAGEAYIAHAMMVTADKDLKDYFNAGLDLSAVRSVKVFAMGKITNMGRMAIVEAKDTNGKDLGSFLGGFLVSPCK